MYCTDRRQKGPVCMCILGGVVEIPSPSPLRLCKLLGDEAQTCANCLVKLARVPPSPGGRFSYIRVAGQDLPPSKLLEGQEAGSRTGFSGEAPPPLNGAAGGGAERRACMVEDQMHAADQGEYSRNSNRGVPFLLAFPPPQPLNLPAAPAF